MTAFADTIQFSLLAAFIALDQMACFQMLLSRPIFTALILGAAFGDIREAALIGICFECLFFRSIPMKERASADPTLATAAALGGVWGAPFSDLVAFHPFLTAPFAAGLGLLAAFLSKWFDLRLRGANTALSQRLHRPGTIQATAGLALFAKSFGFYLLTILAVQGALPQIVAMLGPSVNLAGAMAWGAFVCICVAFAASTLIQTPPLAVLWGFGLILGTAFVVASQRIQIGRVPVAFGIYAVFLVVAAFEIHRYYRRVPKEARGRA